MNIIVAGGTGFIGSTLIRTLLQEKHAVTLLTRTPSKLSLSSPGLQREAWDTKTAGPWIKHIESADAVINLTGELIGGKRWSASQKERILESRVNSTRTLVRAMGQASKKPSVLINASAVGYYGDVPSGDVPESFPKGHGFLADVCGAWEDEAFAAQTFGVRVVMLRTGVVLAPDGGALERMMLPFTLFAGGPIGSGRQWFPWIHRDDVVGSILFLLNAPGISGPMNLVAPEPVTMKEFSKQLGLAMNRPSWAPVPSPILRVLLGEMAGMILTGQRAVPKRLMEAGYVFRFPTLSQALHDVVHQ